MGEIVIRRQWVGAAAARSRAALRRAESALPGLVALVGVGGLCAAQGGYFPTSWGLAALGFSWLTTLLLILRPTVRVEPLELVLLLGVAGLVGWVALSLLWSENVPGTVLEVQRGLVYVTGVAALLLVTRRRSVPALLAGVLGAIVVVTAYGLGTRLFPADPGDLRGFGGYRLATPVGYWNGLGILAALGIVLALGFAARGRTIAGRALAASSVVLLLPALYFTFSRGAIVALAIGLAVAVLFDRRRLQLVATLAAVAPAPVFALWLSSRSDGLTRAASTFEHARADGRALAPALLALMAVAAGAAALFALAERRFVPGRRVRLAWAAVLLLAVAIGLGGTFARFGDPVELARKAERSFEGGPTTIVPGEPLSKRLFTLSNNGRLELWRAAWRDAGAHPVRGSGAGTFEQYWLEHRPPVFAARDAHSLYLEVLAELGPVGIALLGLLFGAPVAAAFLARRHPLTAAALGAYVAFLAHAAVDWDWELPGVTLAALACGVALLVAARRNDAARPLPVLVRTAAIALAISIAGFAFVGHMGNRAVAASQDLYDAGAYVQAEAEAREAIRRAPWSAEAWQALGDAQLGLRAFDEAARSYRRAIAKNARSWTAWYDLGNVTRGVTRRRAYERAAALNPHSPNIAALREWGRLPKLPAK